MALILQDLNPAPDAENGGRFLYFLSPSYGFKHKVDAIASALKREKIYIHISKLLTNKHLTWPRMMFTLKPQEPDQAPQTKSDVIEVAVPSVDDGSCTSLKRPRKDVDDDEGGQACLIPIDEFNAMTLAKAEVK